MTPCCSEMGRKRSFVADAWQWWDAATISRASGCPESAVRENWPLLAAGLERRGLYTRDNCLGVIGTVAIETASTFRPIHEYGTPADWARYEGGSDFAGRGYIQITHLSNYRATGATLGLDLVGDPDMALVPTVAADVLAWYWDTKTIPAKDGSRVWTLTQLCADHDWIWVRRAVQGGTDGLDRLIAIATTLDAIKEPPVPTYNPAFPAFAQNDQWSCAPTSLRWALWAFGRQPAEQWIESTMQAEGVVSQAQGILDASGAGLAAFVERQYGDAGFEARNVDGVTFDAVRSVAGASPVLLGGRRWGADGHWSGVRGYDAAQDVLLLANPSSGYGGIGQTMSRQQFAGVMPASMVVVTNSAVAAPSPIYAQPGQVGSGLLGMMAEDQTAPALPSTWLPLGSQSATVEECIGLNGVRYVFHLPTGARWRYPAA